MSSNLVLLTKQQLSYLEQRGGEDDVRLTRKDRGLSQEEEVIGSEPANNDSEPGSSEKAVS
jgi:hypothetical protein